MRLGDPVLDAGPGVQLFGQLGGIGLGKGRKRSDPECSELLGVVRSDALDLRQIVDPLVGLRGVGPCCGIRDGTELRARRPVTGRRSRRRFGLLPGVPHCPGHGAGKGEQAKDSLHQLDDSGGYGLEVVVVVVLGATVVLVVEVEVDATGAAVVVVVVEDGGGTVVGDTVVVVGGSVVLVVVVVVVEGGTTEPLPQQLFDGFQCFQPPLEYTSQAATAVLATGS